MAKKKKKHCAPQILGRIFGNRAQPLLRTIISLLTPPQTLAGGCKWCSDNRCLNCSVASGEDEAVSFLLRPEDPHDYRNLLTDCFIVVEENAPRIDGCCPLNPYECTQRVMVQGTIEMIQYKNSKLVNVLCNGYDKAKSSSSILECLTSPAWCLLFERVGASFMYHLLQSASIFLPLPCQKYLQVAGPPITNLRHMLRRKRSPIVEELGAQKKRKVGHAKLFLDGDHVNSFDIGHASTTLTDSQRSVATAAASASCPTFRKDNSPSLTDGLVQNVPKSRKRDRPFKWQRQKRKKQLKVLKNGINVSSGDLHSLNSTPMEKPVLCSCCLRLKAMKKLNHGTLIERNKMFYNLETSSSVFPESHELTILKGDARGSTSLVHEIFELLEVDKNTRTITCVHNSHCCRTCSSCPYHSMIKLLKKLIRRSYYREHLKLLDRHCPLPLSMQDASQVDVSEVDKIDASVESCSIHQVVSFVWAVLRSIVPVGLLGDQRTLRRNIYRFIRLRRFEKFSVTQCLHKVKTSKFELFTISNPQSSSSAETRKAVRTVMSDLKQSILKKWIYWIFSSLVVELVQSNFYVTESEHGKHEMYYYRKSAWKAMTGGAINAMQRKMMCRNMNVEDVQKIVRKRCFGFSKLRFVQKGKNGLRMLANLKASSIIPASYPVQKQTHCWNKMKKQTKTFNGVGRLKSVNNGLRKTLAVLKGIKLKEPERLVGSFVSDYNEVHRKLCSFILSLKKKPDDSSVYMVACDVRKAYDSINQDKLLNIMRDVVKEAEYPLIESSELISTKNSSFIRDHLRPAALNLTTGLKFWTSSARSVVVDKGKPNVVKGKEILSDIKEVVRQSIWKVEDKFYLQTVGIPQGSIISPSLCAFYYGHLEHNVIIPFLDRALHKSNAAAATNGSNDTPQVERLLLRFMDDFLFLTNSKEQASWFFKRLKRGFRDYNCYMNDEKFFLNFGVGESVSLNNISQKRRVHVSQYVTTLFLKWSGLLINSVTLEVQADYSKYLSSHVRSTLTVSWQKKPEMELKNKLFGFLRPKFHPILIDSNINSAAIVRLNIYQVFLLSAMKFHCYVCDLSYFCKSSPSLHFEMIKQSFRYMWRLISRRMMRCKYNDVRPVVKLKSREVEWLGLVAFVRVLKRKQSRHQQLIDSLISQLSKHKTSRSVSPDLKYAIDKSHSSVLWELQY